MRKWVQSWVTKESFHTYFHSTYLSGSREMLAEDSALTVLKIKRSDLPILNDIQQHRRVGDNFLYISQCGTYTFLFARNGSGYTATLYHSTRNRIKQTFLNLSDALGDKCVLEHVSSLMSSSTTTW